MIKVNYNKLNILIYIQIFGNKFIINGVKLNLVLLIIDFMLFYKLVFQNNKNFKFNLL